MTDRPGNVISLRIPQLIRLLRCRCGIQLPDDDAGREYAALMLEHLCQLADPGRRMSNFLDLWTPWMGSDEREAMKQAAATSGARWSADRLGEALQLTVHERTTCRITTIGAAGDSSEAREERRKEKKRERERARRQRKNGQPRKIKQARRGMVPSPRAMIVWDALPNHGSMSSVTELMVELQGKPPLFSGADGATLRRRLLRAIKELEGKGLAKTKTEIGPRGLPVLFVGHP